MSPDEYQDLAMRTEADQSAILLRVISYGVQGVRLEGAVRGLSDESGELSSAVKKFVEYGKPLDRDNIIEEVGDCLWRLAQVCKAINTTLEHAMVTNLLKLKVRYPEGYNDWSAQDENRDREAERNTLAQKVIDSTKCENERIQMQEQYDLKDKKCEVCHVQATIICHDSSRDFKREEHHYFCKIHNQPTAILPNK